jgi:hypothetical protein
MKTYKVTGHAVERAIERLGWNQTEVVGRVNDLMQSAHFQGETQGSNGETRKIFDHQRTRIRMIVGKSDAVITVYPLETTEEAFAKLPTDLAQAIRKKAATLSRKYTKELRQVEREVTSIEFEIARRKLNKLRVNNPKTKAFIDAKLTELKDMRDSLAARQSELTEQLAELAKHQ